MPPPVAALITLSFCAYMLWREQRLHPNTSKALWLPFIWMFFICSRFPGQWLVVLGLPAGIFGPSAEGTPMDAIIFLGLTLLGLRVLSRRGLRLADFIHDNRAITIFLLYCLLAVMWSDMPFVSLKRWIKILGHPVMMLVILTDRDPSRAVRLVFRNAAILLLPLSLLFIRYYPELGRSYDQWTGTPFMSGVTTMKNSLGAICLIYALFFCWDIMTAWKMPNRQARRRQLVMSGSFLVLAVYLLDIAESATSLACFILGAAVMLLLAARLVRAQAVGITIITGLIVMALGEAVFGIRESVILALGRDTTLTDRTDLWAVVFSIPNNALLGAGFEMFWSGERLAMVEGAVGWPPNQAHSGYIETYLNLGLVGVIILVAWIFASFRKLQSDMLTHYDAGIFGLGFFFAILAYNYTEAAFKAMHPIWTMLFLISLRCDAFRRRGRGMREWAQTRLAPFPRAPEIVQPVAHPRRAVSIGI